MTKNDKPFHHGNLRRALIETALATLGAQGVEALTMRGLSQAIGVSRTAAYRHFESKRDLLFAVAEEGFRTIERLNLGLMATAGPDALDILEAFGRAYLGFALESPALYRLLFGDELIGEDRPESMVAMRARAFGTLTDTFRRGQDQGRIRPGSVFAMASVMWSTMHGLACLLMDGQVQSYVLEHGWGHLSPGAKDPSEATRAVSDLAMRSPGNPTGRSAPPGLPFRRPPGLSIAPPRGSATSPGQSVGGPRGVHSCRPGVDDVHINVDIVHIHMPRSLRPDGGEGAAFRSLASGSPLSGRAVGARRPGLEGHGQRGGRNMACGTERFVPPSRPSRSWPG